MTFIPDSVTNSSGVQESLKKDLTGNDLLYQILDELKIMNKHLESLTELNLTSEDI